MNDIMDSPLYYLLDVLREKKEVQQSNSFFDLLM